MSTKQTDERAVKDYRKSLIIALRFKDVPGDRIGDIVAQVESHVAETGEDPTEAFGTPKAYAASLQSERRPDPWWATALIVIVSGAAGWFVASGLLALLLGRPYLGHSGWLSLAGGLLLGIPVGVRLRRRSSTVRDPRNGADMVPGSRWGLAALIGLPIMLVLFAWGAIELVDHLIATG